jgi:integrase
MLLNQKLDKNFTLENFIKYFLENCILSNYTKATYDSYKSKMNNYVVPSIGMKRIKDLKKYDIQDLIYGLSDKNIGLSSNSVRQIFTILRKVLSFAVEIELIDRNVSDNVKIPPQIKYNPTVYSKNSVDKLLDKAKNSFLFIIILLGVRLGLRRSEIILLRWNDVDLNSGTVSITKTKKSKHSQRTLKIPKPLLQTLKDHKTEQVRIFTENKIDHTGDTLIVCKGNGEAYNPTFISRKFKEFLEQNDLLVIKLHSLRHTFATHAHNNGMPIKQLSRALGHADSAMSVENYVQIDDEYII